MGALIPVQCSASCWQPERQKTQQTCLTQKSALQSVWARFFLVPSVQFSHAVVSRTSWKRAHPSPPKPPRFRQRLERNRKPSWEYPRPPSLQHRRSTSSSQPSSFLFRANRLCRRLARFLATWKPLVRGIGAPDLLRASVSIFRASHALTGICWHLIASGSFWARLRAKGAQTPDRPSKTRSGAPEAFKRRDRRRSKTGSTAMRECCYRSPQVGDRT